jgi:hypothetical protein
VQRVEPEIRIGRHGGQRLLAMIARQAVPMVSIARVRTATW